MASDEEPGKRGGRAGDPAHDSAKRQGDKLGTVVGKGKDEGEAPRPEADAAGAPAHDSPKRHGDKLEHARDEAAGRGKR
jgi:hypothetical protein